MSRCGSVDRPHRPKRVYGTDDRGRQVLLGQRCECGAIFNRDGRELQRWHQATLANPWGRGGEGSASAGGPSAAATQAPQGPGAGGVVMIGDPRTTGRRETPSGRRRRRAAERRTSDCWWPGCTSPQRAGSLCPDHYGWAVVLPMWEVPS